MEHLLTKEAESHSGGVLLCVLEAQFERLLGHESLRAVKTIHVLGDNLATDRVRAIAAGEIAAIGHFDDHPVPRLIPDPPQGRSHVPRRRAQLP